MMIPYLNTFGLVINLIGVVLLFRYGMPYRVANERGQYIITSSVPPDEKAITERYKTLGKWGLFAIVVGTAAQIAANWIV